ncbi:MAG: carboxypeptidase regulatory-like domain-containing protein [Thermoflexales bacterium]|nr:carboxypeptidase regulatory-like domain-containing protein [Thermoflexales bacterium]
MKSGSLIRITICFFLMIIFGACESPNYPTEETSVPPTPPPFPTSEPNKITVIGKVVSSSGQPVPQVPVWLAEVVRQGDEGVYVLDSRSSPGAYTDINGVFVILNVNAGEYVIVVGDPEALYEIIAEPSGKARVWNIPPTQIFDIGELKVTLLGR